MAAINGIVTAADKLFLNKIHLDSSNGQFWHADLYLYGWSASSAFDPSVWGGFYIGAFQSGAPNSVARYTPNKYIYAGDHGDWGISNPNFTFKNGRTFLLYNDWNNAASGPITLNINDTGALPLKAALQQTIYTNGSGIQRYVSPLKGPEFVTGLYLIRCWDMTILKYCSDDSKMYVIEQGPPLYTQKCIELGTIDYKS